MLKQFQKEWNLDSVYVVDSALYSAENLRQLGQLKWVRVGKVWRSYLTFVLETEMLPPYVVIDLYQKRWRIEDAFNTVK